MSADGPAAGLRRAISLPWLVLYGLGTILVTFALANAALLRVKRRGDAEIGADAVRGARVPRWVPWVGFVASLEFVLFELSRLALGSLP